MAAQPGRRLGSGARLLAGLWMFYSLLVRPDARASQNPGVTQQPQEYVAAQAKAGRMAELEGHVNRTLDADWLQNFIANKNNNAGISHEGVLISNAVIRGRFSLAGAEIKFPLWLNNCEFTDDVDLSWGQFGRSLSLEGSIFDKGADLDHVHLAGDLVIEGAHFTGLVDISGANIGGELDGNSTEFLATSGPAQFDSMQAAQGAEFLGAKFSGGVTFDHLKAPFLLLGLNATRRGSGAPPTALALTRLNLGHASIHGELNLGYLEIANLLANDLVVEGTTSIANTKFTDEVDLRQSHFSSLMLQNVSWPASAEKRQLSGIAFQYIAPAPWDSETSKTRIGKNFWRWWKVPHTTREHIKHSKRRCDGKGIRSLRTRRLRT